MKTGILSLGTRKDATTWEVGCNKLGFDVPLPIKRANPNLEELKGFFVTSPEWIFLAGHFGGLSLSNESDSVVAKFMSGQVECSVEGETEKIIKDKGFSLHKNCKVVVWGGCSVCSSAQTIRTLRSLFGQHVLIGFAGLTGWRVIDAILGGGFIKNNHFFDRIQSSYDDPIAVRDAWMKTAKTGYGKGKLEDIFRAVDPSGQEWLLRNGEIERGRKIS